MPRLLSTARGGDAKQRIQAEPG